MKLTVQQLVKKFSAFYVTRRFITPFHNSTPPVPLLTQINPFHVPHRISWPTISILSPHVRLRLPNGLFPSGFRTQTLHAPVHFPVCYLSHPPVCPWSHNPIIFSEQYKSGIICSILHSPLSASFLGQKYHLKHPILKHLQPMFVPQCERLSSTLKWIVKKNWIENAVWIQVATSCGPSGSSKRWEFDHTRYYKCLKQECCMQRVTE